MGSRKELPIELLIDLPAQKSDPPIGESWIEWDRMIFVKGKDE